MIDEERSMVFDAHEALRKAFNRWEREPSIAAAADLRQAMAALQRIDSQLLANMARALKKSDDPRPERFWWQRD